MKEIEQDYSQTIRYLATFPENETHISKDLVEYWLLNHSNTVFCRGKLRKIVFEKVTNKVYLAKTKEV